MMLSAKVYLSHLRSYINSDYIEDDGSDNAVELKEAYYEKGDSRKKYRKVKLHLPGPGLCFKLDKDDFNKDKKGGSPKPPLFHFLDDEGKPWAKRCDFVIFYVRGNSFCADCIEFKSKSLAKDKIVPQLDAGVRWVRSLIRTVEHYTQHKKRVHVRKFVFSTNQNPQAFLDSNRQLTSDPSVRFFHYDEVQGKNLAELPNESTQTL
jgi:hypothetical protein